MRYLVCLGIVWKGFVALFWMRFTLDNIPSGQMSSREAKMNGGVNKDVHESIFTFLCTNDE